MTVLNETYTLNSGNQMPKIGFGTWQMPDTEETTQAVKDALSSGYRLIDTAAQYQNEESVGRAINEVSIDRSDIFVTTKLPANIKSFDDTITSFNESLEKLNLDYVDLYLIHAPAPWEELGKKNYDKENLEVWQAMQQLQSEGKVKNIGVSNFEIADLKNLLSNSKVVPVVNQIKFFIGNTQSELTDFSQKHSIQVEGFSPLATGAILSNPQIETIAKKYNTTIAKIAIRYVIQKNVIPLPKSNSRTHIKDNAAVNFEIDAADMQKLDKLTDTADTLYGPNGLKHQ